MARRSRIRENSASPSPEFSRIRLRAGYCAQSGLADNAPRRPGHTNPKRDQGKSGRLCLAPVTGFRTAVQLGRPWAVSPAIWDSVPDDGRHPGVSRQAACEASPVPQALGNSWHANAHTPTNLLSPTGPRATDAGAVRRGRRHGYPALSARCAHMRTDGMARPPDHQPTGQRPPLNAPPAANRPSGNRFHGTTPGPPCNVSLRPQHIDPGATHRYLSRPRNGFRCPICLQRKRSLPNALESGRSIDTFPSSPMVLWSLGEPTAKCQGVPDGAGGPKCQSASGSWHSLALLGIHRPPAGQPANGMVARPGTVSHSRTTASRAKGPTGQRADTGWWPGLARSRILRQLPPPAHQRRTPLARAGGAAGIWGKSPDEPPAICV